MSSDSEGAKQTAKKTEPKELPVRRTATEKQQQQRRRWPDMREKPLFRRVVHDDRIQLQLENAELRKAIYQMRLDTRDLLDSIQSVIDHFGDTRPHR